MLNCRVQGSMGAIERLSPLPGEVDRWCHPGVSIRNNGCARFIRIVRCCCNRSEAFVEAIIREQRPHLFNVDDLY